MRLLILLALTLAPLFASGDAGDTLSARLAQLQTDVGTWFLLHKILSQRVIGTQIVNFDSGPTHHFLLIKVVINHFKLSSAVYKELRKNILEAPVAAADG